MISVSYVNIMIEMLIRLLPCMLSWFLGSMSKQIFDLSRSIGLKKESRERNETWEAKGSAIFAKKWSWGVHCANAELASNLKVERKHTRLLPPYPFLQTLTKEHIPVSMRMVSWCAITNCRSSCSYKTSARLMSHWTIQRQFSESHGAASCLPPFANHHGAEFGLCKVFLFRSLLILQDFGNLTASMRLQQAPGHKVLDFKRYMLFGWQWLRRESETSQ